MTVADDLKAARALIEKPENWCKGKLVTLRGARCAEGACYSVGIGYARSVELVQRLQQAIHPYFGGAGNGMPTVATFNDQPTTTHNDVLALFDRAIASLATPSVLP